jgi:hypothetical protein
MNRALPQAMTNTTRLFAVLLLLVGCGSSDTVPVDDGTAGPADAFVGVWQGSGRYQTYQDANGGRTWDIDGSVTISRRTSTEVTVDPSKLNGFGCGILIYDIGTDLHGTLRPGESCFATEIVLKDDVLTLSGMYSDGALMQPTTYSESVTLKRAP